MSMSRTTDEQREKVLQAVRRYVRLKKSGTLREIAEYVYSETGLLPATGTVARILRRLGYEHGWKKN